MRFSKCPRRASRWILCMTRYLVCLSSDCQEPRSGEVHFSPGLSGYARAAQKSKPDKGLVFSRLLRTAETTVFRDGSTGSIQTIRAFGIAPRVGPGCADRKDL